MDALKSLLLNLYWLLKRRIKVLFKSLTFCCQTVALLTNTCHLVRVTICPIRWEKLIFWAILHDVQWNLSHSLFVQHNLLNLLPWQGSQLWAPNFPSQFRNAEVLTMLTRLESDHVLRKSIDVWRLAKCTQSKTGLKECTKLLIWPLTFLPFPQIGQFWFWVFFSPTMAFTYIDTSFDHLIREGSM